MTDTTIAVGIAIPTTCAPFLVKLRNAETIPYRFLPALPMMALVLGAIKMLMPVPDNPDAIATKASGESKLTLENKYIATEEKVIPITDGIVVPTLSAMRPLIGPKIAKVIAPGNRYKAANAVVRPNPETK